MIKTHLAPSRPPSVEPDGGAARGPIRETDRYGSRDPPPEDDLWREMGLHDYNKGLEL